MNRNTKDVYKNINRYFGIFILLLTTQTKMRMYTLEMFGIESNSAIMLNDVSV